MLYEDWDKTTQPCLWWKSMRAQAVRCYLIHCECPEASVSDCSCIVGYGFWYSASEKAKRQAFISLGAKSSGSWQPKASNVSICFWYLNFSSFIISIYNYAAKIEIIPETSKKMHKKLRSDGLTKKKWKIRCQGDRSPMYKGYAPFFEGGKGDRRVTGWIKWSECG